MALCLILALSYFSEFLWLPSSSPRTVYAFHMLCLRERHKQPLEQGPKSRSKISQHPLAYLHARPVLCQWQSFPSNVLKQRAPAPSYTTTTPSLTPSFQNSQTQIPADTSTPKSCFHLVFKWNISVNRWLKIPTTRVVPGNCKEDWQAHKYFQLSWVCSSLHMLLKHGAGSQASYCATQHLFLGVPAVPFDCRTHARMETLPNDLTSVFFFFF